jgi:hypothetical protein
MGRTLSWRQHPLLDDARWSRPYGGSRSLHADITPDEDAELERDEALRAELEHFYLHLKGAHPGVDALLCFFRGTDGSLNGFVELWEDRPGHFRWSRLVKP